MRELREKGLWLVDPELCNGGSQNQQCDDKILVGSGCWPLKREKQDRRRMPQRSGTLHTGVLEMRPSSLRGRRRRVLARRKAAFDESSAFKKIKHVDLFTCEIPRRASGAAGVGVDNRADAAHAAQRRAR